MQLAPTAVSSHTDPVPVQRIPLHEAWESPERMPTRQTIMLTDRPDSATWPASGLGFGGWMQPAGGVSHARHMALQLSTTYDMPMAVISWHPFGAHPHGAFAVAPLVQLDWKTNGGYGGHFVESAAHAAHVMHPWYTFTRSTVKVLTIADRGELIETGPVRG